MRSGTVMSQRQTGQGAPEPLLETEGYPVRVRDSGYIQYADPETILTLAREKDLVIRLLRQPGRFVGRGAVVAQVWPAGRVDERLGRTNSTCLPPWKPAHAHPGCRMRGEPARRNGRTRHVSGDQ